MLASRVENVVAPDQLASDLDLHCFKTGYTQVKQGKGLASLDSGV